MSGRPSDGRVHVAVGMLGAAEPEVVVRLGSAWHHVVREVPDPAPPAALPPGPRVP
ncbi:hypothetical protein [Pseudonocardia hierapolitana]|uniref:hypothetical protein n=1 Tax=Pseudonocardia hierapolitana TaxID=1128676 RepID=UPI001478CB2A|nr:hypothetical protein [Pseudonocardia hierapolitana]